MATSKDDEYDAVTREYLMKAGLPFEESAAPVIRDQSKLPYTAAGLPTLRARQMDALKGTNMYGFMFSSNELAKKDSNRGLGQDVFLSPNARPSTAAHEIEHLLARQNLGFSQLTRDKFGELISPNPTDQMKATSSFLDGLKESLPYLKEKYGLSGKYMTPQFIDKQGRVGLYEILADLGGIESHLGVDLTKDPELRKTMFKDKNVREAYNAVTGLRQTRTDARDLPPYTRLPEKDESGGVVNKLKKLIGYAEGGAIPEAGSKKLI